jgi:hypothetical protein
MSAPTLARYAAWIFWKEKEDIARFVQSLYDNWVAMLTDSTDEWRRFVFVIDDMSSTEAADDARFKIDIINNTGGEIDPTWTDADYNTVFGALQSFAQTYAIYMNANHRFLRVDAYRMKYNEYGVHSPVAGAPDPPFVDSGPPESSHPVNLSGAANTYQSPQVAMSVTLETPIRSHWGRFYLPALSAQSMAPDGHIITTVVDAIADEMNDLVTYLSAQDFYIVVPATRHKNNDFRGLSTVTGIRVDDVADVIRRRRLRHKTHMKRWDVASALQEDERRATQQPATT